MASSEFDIIARYFKPQSVQSAQTQLGIGDDCALLNIPPGFVLAVTTDTMVEGVHFFADTPPEALGHKILAVNLSDLASMGAEPFAITLALTLPAVNTVWLSAFARGLFSLAHYHHVELIGGDTTAGPLNVITLQALGLVPEGQALKRSTAQVGDVICVTGPLGTAGLGLKLAQGLYPTADDAVALAQLHTPLPRVTEGLALRGWANACIDVSDGLLADLGHITQQSAVAAHIVWEALPLIPAVKTYIASTGDWQLPLSAGDDYELCFTIPAKHLPRLTIPYTSIGTIVAGNGVQVRREGKIQTITKQGYEHFRT